MLERTAAGLESCTLQRVLPKPTKSCRQLHTGFWQHGASAIDLSSIWPGPPRTADSEPADVDSGPRQGQTNLLASAFLLDFLYPSATLPLLRRIYPKLPRTQDAHHQTVVPRRRQFSSAAADLALDSTSTVMARSRDVDLGDGGPPRSGLGVGGTPAALESRPDRTESKKHHHPSTAATQTEAVDLSEYDAQEMLDRLKQLIDDAGHLYNDVWDLYTHADHENRLELRAGLVKYLVRSHGVVENGRALSVFRQIPQDEWDDDLLASGVLLFLRNADLPSAIDNFKTGLAAKGLTGGLEYLLADAISSRKWIFALDVWVAYCTAQAKKSPRRKPSADRLKKLEGLPNQGNLYFAFRNFLVSDGAEYRQQLRQSPVSDMACNVFRKHFAHMALWQPCSPDQAAIILETLNDKDLYNDYFVRMFDRWYEKLEPQSNIVKLPAMYQKFRNLPNAKPAMPVLRGMFKVHFPKDIAALEQLYHDWIRFRGDLNQWGYEKFLKLYAQRGDVAAVQKLWVKYVKAYPEVLKTPRAFRSTLNVYAQAGDAAQAEKALQEMFSKYGVEPDLDCWNTLLKAYMRVNDYPQVLRCFDEISEKHAPDSFTYAHVMAMSSKKGDLETTLDFFNRSQVAQVPITKEIGLALVVAYCQNDLLVEAERLCIEMAERKLTHAAIWNQLLNFYGEARDLRKCYAILERMKNFGVQWDDDTHRFLLQALVNVNQIHSAYALLKGAEDEELFSVTPEHYAIVMAGAARVGEYLLVNSLHHRLQKSNMPVSFKALIAVVETAVQRKPGVGRTLNLSKELVEHFRQDVAGSSGEPGHTATSSSPTNQSANPAMSKSDQQNVGRAIMLLVELREFGTVEELMTLYNGLFPQFKNNHYPPNVMSALMLAYYKDENMDKVMELWHKTWEQMLKTGKNSSTERIYSGHEYDLSRVLNIVLRVFRDQNDGQGLSDCINRVTKEGFKLTCATWSLAVRYLAELGRWERAMYWCETMLMDGWRGWNWGRNNGEKAAALNTRFLRAPKQVVFRLQQKWLDMRKMAAWSQDVSHQLHNVQEHFPRLYHAFTTSDMETLPLIYQAKEDTTSARDVDKVLRNMPYKELIKAKEQLLKQLAKEQKREKSLGMATAAPMTAAEHQEWKQELHKRIRRYAAKWAQRREERFAKAEAAEDSSSASATTTDPDQVVAGERSGYWNNFWNRYDQRPHGERRTQHAKRTTRSRDLGRKPRSESGAASKQRSNDHTKR
ncbi:hypothetical protein AK830_g2190 [Neonectria ditissima]|uniref:Pentatricopeptide repeat-containing protein n=1 Tax=Neonectria ditissima TaxID=78410 RepID=A0A0P7BG24_9HYPO|nr:hypothetical protein AK830_g2190 [Neonectria ditissima]